MHEMSLVIMCAESNLPFLFSVQHMMSLSNISLLSSYYYFFSYTLNIVFKAKGSLYYRTFNPFRFFNGLLTLNPDTLQFFASSMNVNKSRCLRLVIAPVLILFSKTDCRSSDITFYSCNPLLTRRSYNKC